MEYRRPRQRARRLAAKRRIGDRAQNFAGGCMGAAKEFFWIFLDTSSIHGLKYLPPCKNLHFFERFLWALWVVLAVWGAVALNAQTLRRFLRNPTVVSMEHDYKEWNTSFPSITLCPSAKYSEAKARKLVNEEFGNIEDKAGLVGFILALANSSYSRFGDVPPWPGRNPPPASYWRLVFSVTFPFYYNVSNSNAESYTQTEMNPVFTEVGLCYSYNSVTTIYNDPKKWEINSRKYLGKLKIFEGSQLDGDIFAQVMNMNTGYGLYILAPNEFPDVAIPQVEDDNNTYKTLDLTALSIVSSPAVERLSVQQRRCRLQHESDLLTSPVYSYNLCRMECRMKAAFQLCGCVPFFYRPTEGYPVCDSKGMKCLDRNSVLLIKLLHRNTGRKLPCDCLPLCSEVNYIIDTDNTMSWTLGTNLKLGLIKYPKFRLKRDILFGWTDLLVSIGGTAGLFLGSSLLSFAEIVYFLTLRLFWFAWRRGIAQQP